MDRRAFVYSAGTYQRRPARDAASFPSQTFTMIDDGLVDSDMIACIDPELESLVSFDHTTAAHWGPAPVQRYLSDPGKTAFFNPSLPLHDGAEDFGASGRAATSFSPLPHPARNRFGSPVSSQDVSTLSGSALSPLTEPPLDGLPASPESEAWMSPYSATATADHWTPGFPGLSSIHAGAYVNPADVNPAQEPPPMGDYLDSDTFNLDLHSLPGDFSLDTCSGRGDQDAPGHWGSTNYGHKGSRTPIRSQTPVKDEIEALGDTVEYRPHPSTMVADEASGDESGLGLPTKRRRGGEEADEADEEYKPRRRNPGKATSNSSRRSVRVKRPQIHAQAAGKKAGVIVVAGSDAAAASRLVNTIRLAPTGSGGAISCPHSHQNHFKDEGSLDNHINKQHRRPFLCVFHFAGCNATFASKNEWKRHVASQHLVLHYWLCTEGACDKPAPAAGPGGKSHAPTARTTGGRRSGTARASATATPSAPRGAIFNRKDLYTQHLRRMHMPPDIKKVLQQQKKSSSSTATTPEWDRMVARLQGESVRERCLLPEFMRCPVAECGAEFRGADAWDQRMEHVAKHLEQAAVDKEPPVVFGGHGDPTLMQWAASPEVAIIRPVSAGGGGWEQNNPLKNRPVSSQLRASGTTASEHEVDAEGEDDDLGH